MIDVILKRFEAPDETRVLVKGKFEIVRLGGLTVGRATYEPAATRNIDEAILFSQPLFAFWRKSR
jgi:hypothetical protein